LCEGFFCLPTATPCHYWAPQRLATTGPASSCFSAAKFQSLIVRRGHKRAIVALAHKMLRTIFFMLKRGEHYRDSATNYEQLSVQRNASRWIKALTRFGFIPAAA
jgi:hypothetical protein